MGLAAWEGSSCHLGFSLPHASVLDVVSPKMFEELKSRLDGLAQEVALLKEQQALQTGECRERLQEHTQEGTRLVRKKAQSPGSATLTCCPHMLPLGRLPSVHL